MGGQDETRARAVLMAMQERLAEGPYVALGIASTATAAEIRAAFLQLTKTYHPARFGYMSGELQKLSNEVFLSLRAAHDSIAKPARAAAAARSDRSGTYPRSDRSGVFPAVGQPQKSERATPPNTPLPVPPTPPSPPFSPVRATPSRLPSPVQPTDARGTATPPTGVRVGGIRPVAQPATSGARPPAAAAQPDERELAGVLEQLKRGEWEAARATLSTLAGRAPDVPRYRALLAYARGREAQLAYQLDEARVELQDALQIDPDLQLAKTALAQLFTRRK